MQHSWRTPSHGESVPWFWSFSWAWMRSQDRNDLFPACPWLAQSIPFSPAPQTFNLWLLMGLCSPGTCSFLHTQNSSKAFGDTLSQWFSEPWPYPQEAKTKPQTRENGCQSGYLVSERPVLKSPLTSCFTECRFTLKFKNYKKKYWRERSMEVELPVHCYVAKAS